MLETESRPAAGYLRPRGSTIDRPRNVTSPVIADRVLTGRDRLVFIAITLVWGIANIGFWAWWARPEHIVTIPRFIVASVALSYDLTLMPLVFIFMLYRMKRPRPITATPGLRVAMVTAIVPSQESLEVLERTLAAMTAVRYPHDNWVLDEGGDTRVRNLCARYGAQYWSRKGIPEFNQASWPYQAKTKSGNYNSWLHDVAYARYDFLVQLDTDHAPVENYLDDVLGYFTDPDIAYVAMPSVYWNLDDWTARGSSEQSQIFQGPIQMGYYGWAGTPMIIGSHAAYRMAHLREIGGFAPSRAEDHLDSLRFAQKGYRGVFVPEVLATGLGPHTLADYLVQEHQWAFSIMQVLMKYGREKGLLTLRQRIVFLFSEAWYGLYALCYLALYILPLLALLTNRPIVNVPFLEFLAFSMPVTLVSLVGVAWGYRRGWYRPGNHFFLSWQGMLLTVARWPIVLVAIFNAIISIAFRNGAFTYMVTPKGPRTMSSRDSVRVATPFIVLAIVPIITMLVYPRLVGNQTFEASGYVVFALINAILFTLLVLATVFDQVRINLRSQISRQRVLAGVAPLAVIVALLVQGILAGGTLNQAEAFHAITYRPSRIDNGTIGAITPEIVVGAPETGLETHEPTPSVVDSGTVSSWLFDVDRSGVTFGAYDPHNELTDMSNLDHLFTRWSDDGVGGVPVDEIRSAYRDGVPVLLSYEPWPSEGMSSETLLDDVIQGRYDDDIRQAALSLSELHQPILVRFAHEMDLDGLYPWSVGDPAAYGAMYRHVVNIFREEGVSNVLWVWSPAGTSNALLYYPGDAYVDYVGMTILEYTGWELQGGYTSPREFKDLINEKYALLDPLGKPMIITETGIDLDPTLKSDAVQQMINALPWFPHIRGVVYFNDQNPVTPIMTERPEWMLRSADRDRLRDELARYSWIEPMPAASKDPSTLPR